MGVYTEYLDRSMSFQQQAAERKLQLTRISQLRGGRDIIVYAADARKHKPPGVSAMIDYSDVLPFTDQLSNLNGSALDVILETPGGYAEAAEDLVRQIRDRYSNDVAFIVPGWAKSAGTIIVMSGNEILMGPGSALGPIDAQLSWQGKVFSAEAFLEGLKKIKEETDKSQTLNRAYIPILQNISPGEIQHAENALSFAQKLVTEWLCKYKFQFWETHSSSGAKVTEEERRARASDIAAQLCNHGRWLTHGRSIKLHDLVDMRLKITDYSQKPDLYDAIRRYHTLLQMTFDTNIYKLFETPTSQIYRFAVTQSVGQQKAPTPEQVRSAVAELQCGKCGQTIKVQLDFEPEVALEADCLRYPVNDILECPQCKTAHNVSDMRRQVEGQIKREVVR